MRLLALPSFLVTALAIAYSPFCSAARASGEVITVTTLHDVRDFGGSQRVADLPGPDGKVAFGEAVTAANNEPGPQTIHFAIPLAEYWLIANIALLELDIGPFVLTDDETTVDFRTQTDFAGDTNPAGWEVGIYGLQPNGWGAAAIFVLANRCTLIGLDDVLQRGYGIELQGNDNRVLACTTDGPLYAAINVEGVFGGAAATRNVIGGTGPGEGNIVSGGSAGIVITGPADDNAVVGNTCIGSPYTGISVIAATRYGVFARRNRIGGPTPLERNWVAGNGKSGEEGYPVGAQIEVNDADDTIVEGNVVGTTEDGMADHPSARGPIGIGVSAARGTLVRHNLVSGILVVGTGHYAGQHFGVGISVAGVCDRTTIVGNRIGTDATGNSPIANATGITVMPFTARDLPLHTMIGGLLAAEANVIAFNERVGVAVDGLVGSVAIRGNRIFDNGELGIDLYGQSTGSGVTFNDQDDVDTNGGNHLQNFPLVDHAINLGSSVRITGRLNSIASQRFAIDLYASQVGDPSGFGEGAYYFGSIEVTTDTGGDARFDTTFAAPVPAGWFVTATATLLSTNETSEFSAIEAVVGDRMNVQRRPQRR